MDTCRACLSSLPKTSMCSLDETLVQQYNMLTNLNVAMMDGMPQYMCQSCVDTIQHYLEFKKRCATAESTLQSLNIKSEDLNEQLTFEIKEEIKTEHNSIEDSHDSIEDSHHSIEDSHDSIEDSHDSPLFVEDNFGTEEYSFIEEKKPERKSNRIKNKKSSSKEFVEEEVIKRNDKNMKIAANKIQARIKKKSSPCGICDQILMGQEELNQHLETHLNDKVCQNCSEAYERWPELLAHRYKHISVKNVDCRCHICSKTCKNVTSLEYHYLSTHYEGIEKRMKCKECPNPGYYCTNLKNLRYHMKQTHSDGVFSCEHCDKIFRLGYAFRRHQATHSDARTHRCDHCEFASKDKNTLTMHILAKHTPGTKRCNRCNRLFKSSKHFDAHLQKCGKVRKSKMCAICGKILTNKSNAFKKHMATHEEQPRYKCDLCPKALHSEGGLRCHKDRHKGIKRFQCKFCDFRAYACSVVTKHQRVHTGEKPYVCAICEKGFTGNNNLKVHMKTHGVDAFQKNDKVPQNSVT